MMAIGARLQAAWQALRSSPENPSVSLAEAIDVFGWGSRTTTGMAINSDSAMRLTTVFRCVAIHAEGLACLPLKVYRRRADGGREVDTAHHVSGLMQEPNQLMTLPSLLTTVHAQVVGRGNGLGWIFRDRAGRAVELWPVIPGEIEVDATQPRRPIYRSTETDRVLNPDNILHVPGIGDNGIIGKNPIELAREAVGLGMAAEQYGGRFFGNDSTPSGILTSDQSIKQEQADEFARRWEKMHKGVGNSHRIAVLGSGLKHSATAISQKDSQFIELRKFQVAEIARLFGVPPHMLADTEKSTSWGSGIEQQTIGFITYTLRPWIVRWERELTRKLFTREERRTYFVEFSVDGLARADLEARYKSYAVAITNGWMNRNEVRRLENLNPAAGLNEFLTPANMTVGQPDPEAKEESAA